MLTQLRIVAADLNAVGAQWALVGALAVSVHTEPRTTRDIDIAVSIDGPHSQEKLLQALIERGYRNRQVLMHLAPTHRLGDRLEIILEGHAPLAIDLLFSSSGIEKEVVAAAVAVELVPSVIIPVACPGHLIAMKVLSQNSSDRIRDRSDLQNLLVNAVPLDVQIAREAIEHMSQRGFSRGKNLIEELVQAIAAFAPHLRDLEF
jgi:hypothetical protein